MGEKKNKKLCRWHHHTTSSRQGKAKEEFRLRVLLKSSTVAVWCRPCLQITSCFHCTWKCGKETEFSLFQKQEKRFISGSEEITFFSVCVQNWVREPTGCKSHKEFTIPQTSLKEMRLSSSKTKRDRLTALGANGIMIFTGYGLLTECRGSLFPSQVDFYPSYVRPHF